MATFNDVGSSILEDAINGLQESKKQIVDDMFKRLDETNKSDFEQSLANKEQRTQTMSDHYQSDMDNTALSEKQRQEAHRKYEEMQAELQKLEADRKKYEEAKQAEEQQTVRYSFDNKDEYQQFVEEMADQNIYVNTSDAQVNGSYVCEIYEVDRQYAETYSNNQNYTMYEQYDYSSQNPRGMSSAEMSAEDVASGASYNYTRTDKDGNTHYYREEMTSGDVYNAMKDQYGQAVAVGAVGSLAMESAIQNKVSQELRQDAMGGTVFVDTALDVADLLKSSKSVADETADIERLLASGDADNIAKAHKMMEDRNIYHTYSNETHEMLDKYAKDEIEDDVSGYNGFSKADPEKKAFAKEMTDKYGVVFGQGLVGLTPQQMIEINSAFIQKHADLVVFNGKVDFSKLEKMSLTQLKAHGISAKEKEFILNANKALNLNGKVDWNNLVRLKPNTRFLHTFKQLGEMQSDVEDEDLAQAKANAKRGYDASKKIYGKGKDVHKIITERAERARLKKATSGVKNKTKKELKKEVTKAGKKVVQNTVSEEVAKRASVNYARMMTAKLNEKLVFLQRIQQAKMAVMQKIGESALGTAIGGALKAVASFVTGSLIPYACIGAGIFALIGTFIVFIVIIYTGIVSLFDIYTGQSVASKLAEVMTTEEEAWHDQLLDLENLWSKREEYKYGYRYKTYEQYTGSNDGNTTVGTDVADLYSYNHGGTTGVKFYICPWKNHSVNLAEWCKDVTDEGFSLDSGGGGCAYEIDTNYNLSRQFDPTTGEVILDEGYGEPQSGHTSNIKDIIAMADIMFQFDQNASTDGQVQSITGSEFDMDWANFKNNCVTAVKFVGASISSFWDSDAMSDFDAWATEHETTSYHCLLSYCLGLFEASHQEKINWEVVYLPTVEGGDVICAENIDGDETYSNLVYDGSYSQNGKRATVCPKAYDEYGNYVGGCEAKKLYAFVYKDAYGTIINGGLGFYEATTTNIYNNGTTIQTHLYYGGSDNIKSPSGIHVDDTNSCLPSTVGGGIYNYGIGNAVLNHSDCWSQISSTVSTSSSGRGSDWNSNYHDWGTPHEGWEVRMQYDQTREGTENHLVAIHYTYSSYTRGHLDGCTYHSAVHDDPSTEENEHEDAYWDCCDACCEGSTGYKETVTVYYHTCQGHDCHYCGGHLVADIHGFVYSMTDEQWFCFSGEGVGEGYEIVGKIDLDNIPDYARTDDQSNFNIYNHSGGTDATWLDGINLNDNNYARDNWQLATSYGTGTASDGCRLFLAQDIFDIDLGILYGSTQFPIRHFWEYEGWTQENMQMACAKASADWQEYYDFDIPINMGEKCLSDTDIAKMVDLIALTYQAYEGEEMPEYRRICVETALRSVGRGNYSQAHHGHLYRTFPCNGHECNKGDCNAFASYCANKAFDTTSIAITIPCATTIGTFDSCWSNKTIKAGDMIYVDGSVGRHIMVYCGFIDLEACYNAGLYGSGSTDYELPTTLGNIQQLQPITCDLTPLNNYGNIYLQNCVSGGLTMSYLDECYVTSLDSFAP